MTAVILVCNAAAAAPQHASVFVDDFRQGLSGQWKTVGGTWKVKDGILRQDDSGSPDLKKAILVAGDADSADDIVITAKIRIDAAEKGKDARVGISVCTDPKTARGLNLVFHDGKLQWLRDYVAWGPGCPFTCDSGKWYWIKMLKRRGDPTTKKWIDEGNDSGELRGKAWADGSEEPADWMVRWTEYDDSLIGYPGLNGGSSGQASVAFAEFKIERLPRAGRPRYREAFDLNLNGAWQVHEEPFDCIGEAGLATAKHQDDGWLPAQVPGEIHLDLIRAGRMPEPTVGTNMPKCRWPETRSWWYRTTFDLPENRLDYERQRLIFDGIDLYGQVFLNGKMVGEAFDAFVPARFDAKLFLRPGRNELVVRVTAGSELSHDPAAAGGKIPNPRSRNWESGRIWLRKPAFSYGWDWVDALPNIAIWRGVRLESRRHVVFHDLRLDTVRQNGRVFVELEAVLENLHARSERACVLELAIHPPDGGPPLTRRYAVDAMPGRFPVRDLIEIPNAKLWWPNTMGDQPLYGIVARVLDGVGAVCDRREFSIGLRTIEIDRSRLPEGSRFCFRVNGREVFCRGGNIGPQDPILARVSDAKYRALIAEAKNAHMNMIRINGCSIFEQPAFYDACDHAGILIFHDFMMTERKYPENDASFVGAVRAEIESILPLLRSHPSIALWSGNNEASWFNLKQPGEGQKFYNEIFPDLCRQLDPRRPYWQGSPAGGREPNDETSGDCHWWLTAFMDPKMDRRIRHEVYDECRARFVSEYGILGPCNLDSIREYLKPEEMTPASRAWRLHTNEFEHNTLAAAIRYHYADPGGLSIADYVKYGQMFQAIMHGNAMEALRFRKHDPVNDCAGALIWSYSDCWGETGWSILDYYLRRKASYYWFRRACAPVKVIVRRRGDELVTRIVNDLPESVTCTLERGWWRLDGGDREVESKTVTVDADDMLEVGGGRVPSAGQRDPRRWLYAAVLRGEDGNSTDQSVCILLPYRKLALQTPRMKVTRIGDDTLEISSQVFAHAVHVEDHGHELISDNWFDLLPGVPMRVRVAAGHDPQAIDLEAVMPELEKQ
jgi:beta-mannosidase